MLIRCIDIESTGFEAPPTDTVVEAGWVDVESTGQDLISAPVAWRIRKREAWAVNPGRPIPITATAIHHITDDDVKDAPRWSDVLPSIVAPSPGDSLVLCAHTAKMERQHIPAPADVLWLDTYKCALRFWREAPIHSNVGLHYWRGHHVKARDLARSAHRALPDATITAGLLLDLLAEHSVEELIKVSSEPALQIHCWFGQNRGRKWTEVDDGLLYWVLDKDFDEEVLFTVRHELERRRKAEEEWRAANEPIEHASGQLNDEVAA